MADTVAPGLPEVKEGHKYDRSEHLLPDQTDSTVWDYQPEDVNKEAHLVGRLLHHRLTLTLNII